MQAHQKHTLRSETIFGNWKPYKSDKKCFLFRFKSSFRSQDISVSVLAFWSCRINGLIKKIRLISNFMTSQPRKQNTSMHIAQSLKKSNQTMKFGQLIEYNIRNFYSKIFQKNLVEKLFTGPKNSKLSFSLDRQSEILYSLTSLHVQVDEYQTD